MPRRGLGLLRGRTANRLGGASAASASLLVLGLFLSGCSSVPEEINPVSWYHGVEGWFGDEDQTAEAPAAPAPAKAEESPGAKQSFPTLAQVPEKPADVTSLEQRRKIMEGLAADRQHAEYADEGEAATAPAPAKTKAAVAAPAPSEAAPPESAPSETAASEAAPPAPPAEETGGEVAAAKTPEAPLEAPPAALPAPGSLAARAAGLGNPPVGMPAPAAAPAPPAASESAATAPPPPPAPAAAPAVPAETPRLATAAGPAPGPTAAPGTGTLGAVYQSKLQESAPTVTTAPAGPTDMGAIAPAAGPGPGMVAEPAESEGAVAFGSSATFHSLEELDGRGGPSTKVATIQYASGSAQLTESEVNVLRGVARMYKERGGTIRVVGHASSHTRDMDPVRHQMVNFTVSVRRADMVARELMRLGVRAGDIYVGAMSDSDPIYLEAMPAGEAANRRTEIFIDY
jgi:flagellar motor protein MotB